MEHFISVALAVLKETSVQLLVLFGALLLFGIILYFLARFTRVAFIKSMGQKSDIYFTGLIGTPVHELGHAMFCIPFGHKITELKLFEYDKKTGTLGYVNHSYNPRNIWHNIGNFFIGIGPLVSGSAAIFLIIKYLLPNNIELLNFINTQTADVTSLSGLRNSFTSIWKNTLMLMPILFSKTNMLQWQFWVFMYVSLCISSHMELSLPDLKGAWLGLLSIVVLLIIINAVFIMFNSSAHGIIYKISVFTNSGTGIFLFATVLSAMFFVTAFLLLNIYTLILSRKMFHPFA